MDLDLSPRSSFSKRKWFNELSEGAVLKRFKSLGTEEEGFNNQLVFSEILEVARFSDIYYACEMKFNLILVFGIGRVN